MPDQVLIIVKDTNTGRLLETFGADPDVPHEVDKTEEKARKIAESYNNPDIKVFNLHEVVSKNKRRKK